MNRRTFLANSGLAGASYAAFPLIRSREKIYRVVLIGSGWWGTNILREAVASERVEVVGLCDVDTRALDKASTEVASWTGKNPPRYEDYQQCLEQTEPDIAIVATPDHWHALNAIAAIEAGAHVYIEKPIAHTLLEGRAILKAARSADRVVQVGTHRRVSPHNMSGMDFLKSGKVGHISMVKCFVNYGGNVGRARPDEPVPEGLNWDQWVGPAPYRPYNRSIHPRGFRQYLDFANGTVGDWGIHWFDQVLWWTEERFPSRISSTGGRFYKQDGADAPDTLLTGFQFESFALQWEHKLVAKNANESANVGCYFYGSNGTFHMGWRDGWTFYPSRKGDQQIHVEPQLNKPDDQNIKELWADFLGAIEVNRRPVCDIEHGYLATNLSLLAMISLKVNRSIRWDGTNILEDSEASALLSRPYRDPWKYPGTS